MQIVKTIRIQEKLVHEHEATKKHLIAPVKALIVQFPKKKQALTLLTGLLADACSNGSLREAIITAANVLKSQEEIIESIGKNMKVIKIGQEILVKKKEEEKKKLEGASSVMSVAEALYAGASKPSSSSAEKRQSKSSSSSSNKRQRRWLLRARTALAPNC